MKILVTGGRGFVGSHTVGRLKNKHEIVTLDTADGQDVRSMDTLNRLMKNADLVVHLAGRSGAMGSKERIWEYLSSNSFGTLNVLEAMRINNVKHMIFTSSFSTYGVPKDLPITETTPLNPNNVYGHSKAVAEELINSYKEEYRITATVLRINMIYGEHQREMNAIQSFVDSALKGEPLIIFGDGTHTREYVYVKDVVECIEKCVEKKPNDLFIVSTEKQYSINDLAKMIVEKIGGTVKNIPKTKFNFNSYADCTKIHENLGWYAKTSLTEGLGKVIEWRKSLSSDRA